MELSSSKDSTDEEIIDILLPVQELTRERDELRASVEALLVLNQDLRARTDDAESAVTTLEWQLSEANKEVERLQRENGALARMYALSEETLRQRTEQLNQADAEIERLTSAAERLTAAVVEIGAAHVAAQAEVEQLRAALEGVFAEADRKTDAFDRAHAALGR